MTSNSTDKQSLAEAVTQDERCISGPLEWTLLVIGIILGVALILFLIRKCVQGPSYCKKNRIDGKVVVITGCNTGIGKETALELARRGAKIYMACRDPVKCEGARLEIIEKTKNENIFNRTLDLGSLESVRKFADKFITEEQRLDILINNAGIMGTPKGHTKDGFDLQFGTNHLGHFLLTNLLLDTLKNSAPSRIIVVSSAAYAIGKINKDDLNSEKSYSRMGAYAQSKLANALFTVKLSEKLHGTNVTVNCLHPGVVKTELARHIFTGRTKSCTEAVMSFFAKTPKAGAQTTIRLALDPSLEKSTGGYYFDTIRCPLLPKAKNKEVAEWLWNVSEEMVGLRPVTQTQAVPVTLEVPPANESNGHTTVIEVEKIPTNIEMTDNKKLEETISKVNGSFGVSEKMMKIAEDEKSEKMDQPEKSDKSEKEMIAKPIDQKTDAIEKSDVQEKLEKIVKDVDNNIAKITSEVVAAVKDAGDILDKIEKPKSSESAEKKNPMENVNAIEEVEVIEEKKMTEKTEKTDTGEKSDDGPEKPK